MNELQKIKGRHRRILMLHELGWSNKKIARFLGVTPQMVSYVVNCTLGRLKGAEIQRELDGALIKEHARIVNLVPAALDLVEDVINNPGAKDSDRLKAAFGIVDRAGLAARQGIDVRHEHAHLHLTPSDIEELHRRGKMLVKRAGILADVTDVTGEGGTTEQVPGNEGGNGAGGDNETAGANGSEPTGRAGTALQDLESEQVTGGGVSPTPVPESDITEADVLDVKKWLEEDEEAGPVGHSGTPPEGIGSAGSSNWPAEQSDAGPPAELCSSQDDAEHEVQSSETIVDPSSEASLLEQVRRALAGVKT